jgi:hypothetical protein
VFSKFPDLQLKKKTITSMYMMFLVLRDHLFSRHVKPFSLNDIKLVFL